MIKKILNAVSLFFGVSKSEARGLMALLGLSVVLLCIPFVHKSLYRSHLPNIHIIIDTSLSVHTQEANSHKPSSPDSSHLPIIKLPIDKVTLKVLLQMGVPRRTASNIIKYMGKGGRFKKPEELRKIYGMDDATLKMIVANTLWQEERSPTNSSYTTESKPQEKAHPQLLDLNTVDSSSLLRIRGIGPTLSKRIVKYRDKLGGFVTLDQLSEVYGLSAEDIAALRKQLTVTEGYIPKTIKINQASYEELARHPYFGYKKSKVILNYLKNHSKFVDFNDFQRSYPFTKDELDKIRQYISYD